MSRYTWILDCGHGGVEIVNGLRIPMTPGKCSPQIPPGFIEGEFVREVVAEVMGRLSENGIAHVCGTLGELDVPLGARVAYANKIHTATQNAINLSIHLNAAGMGGAWRNDATGAAAMHWPLKASSKRLAEVLLRNHCEATGYSDKRGVKARPFKVLSTQCPSALLEAFFMTSELDVAKADPETIAEGLCNTIYEIEEVGL